MKNLVFYTMLAVMMIFSSCETSNTDEVFQDEAALKSGQKVKNFRAHLSGDQEVHEVVSNATGQAIFQLSKDGTELSYKLIVANIDNVTMAHIHVGAVGTNGPARVWLYPSVPPMMLIPGTTNGVLAEGVITASSLMGPLAGQPLSVLTGLMQAGNTYVNVHTTAYPPGEIRGQIFGN
jgi:hypothetical protein